MVELSLQLALGNPQRDLLSGMTALRLFTHSRGSILMLSLTVDEQFFVFTVEPR